MKTADFQPIVSKTDNPEEKERFDDIENNKTPKSSPTDTNSNKLDAASPTSNPGPLQQQPPTLSNILVAYFFASLATLIKTIAWWLNQWPFTYSWSFFLKWFVSASIAGFEYAPLTFAFVYATEHTVPLSLMTAYMEAADNSFRMFQQLALGDTLYWFDWVAAVLLAMCVLFQGYWHRRSEMNQPIAELIPVSASAAEDDTQSTSQVTQPTTVVETYMLFMIYGGVLSIFSIGMILLSLFAGPPGQAYALATVATAAKTFAWWINQYPALKEFTLVQKWLAGWSIAAVIEYFPLIGAFTIASAAHVHLGLMTAYMEAVDNAFRMCQQLTLGKPLYWFDWVAASGMFLAVIFQGILHYVTSGGVTD